MRNIFSILIFLLLIFSFSAGAAGKSYFVSPSGNDSNTGLSQESPFKTIQKAANLTLPGDTVFLMSGTFLFQNTNLSITRSGKVNEWITYKALKGHQPKIKEIGKVWQTVLIEADYIVFEGVELEGDMQNPELTLETAQAYSEEVIALLASGGTINYNKYAEYNTNGIVLGGNNSKGNHDFIVCNCKIHDFPASGIGTARSERITVDNNLIYNVNNYTMWPSSAISLYHLSNLDAETGYKNFIRRNVCYNSKAFVKWISTNGLSDGNGIIIDDSRNEQNGALTKVPYLGRTLIENNLCYNNGGSGIHAYNSDHVDIINNTTFNNGLVVDYAEIFQADASDGMVMNNIMYAKNNGAVNSAGNIQNVGYDYNIYFNGYAAVKGTHDKFADPMFANASIDPLLADFHLTEGSLAIDYATSVFTEPASAPASDILGNVRPQGNGIDAGAYESPFVASPNECFVIAPASGESYMAGANIPISAFAKATEAVVSKIEFYQGSTKLGESTNYPYSFVWKNVSAGNYTITAKAYDSKNVPAVSEGIPVRVSSLESVDKLVNGEMDDNTTGWSLIVMNGVAGNFSLDLNSALSGTNSAMINITTKGINNWEAQFRQKVALVKGRKYTLTFTSKADVNKAIGVAIQKNGSPYTTFYSKNVSLTTVAQNFGPFTYTSSVTDPDCSLEFLLALNLGKVWLDNIVLTEIDDQTKPECSITSPAISASYDNPASVDIAANALATGTTISKVDFYANNLLLGTDKAKPYNFTWTGFKNGDYLLTVVATDGNGNIASSPVINISISNVTGVVNIKRNLVKIFPNPATNFFRIENDMENLVNRISVFNLLGQKLIDIPDPVKISAPIDISALKTGVYFVKMQIGTSNSVQKIIVN